MSGTNGVSQRRRPGAPASGRAAPPPMMAGAIPTVDDVLSNAFGDGDPLPGKVQDTNLAGLHANGGDYDPGGAPADPPVMTEPFGDFDGGGSDAFAQPYAGGLPGGAYLSPGPSVVAPPQPPAPPPRPQQYSRPAPRRRATPQYAQGVAAPMPQRQSIAVAFSNTDDVIQVSRMADGRVTETLPREYPRTYLDTYGLTEHGIRTFLLRHVINEFGGGGYLVRAVSAQGQILMEMPMSFDGVPKSPSSSSNTGAFGAGGANDPRAWAEAVMMGRDPRAPGMYGQPQQAQPQPERPKTAAETLADAIAMKQLAALNDDGSAKIAAVIKPLMDQMNGIMGMIGSQQAMASAPPQKSAFDQMMELRRMEMEAAPKGPTASELAMQAQIAEMRKMAEAANARAEAAERRMEQDRQEARAREQDRKLDEVRAEIARQNNELRAMLQQTMQPPKSLRDQIEEVKDLSAVLGGGQGPGEVKTGDVIMAGLEQWNPANIGKMVEAAGDAQIKTMWAEAEIKSRLGDNPATAVVGATTMPQNFGESTRPKPEAPAPVKDWRQAPLAVDPGVKAKLLKAKTPDEILQTLMFVIATMDTEKFQTSIDKLKNAISYGYEEGIHSHASALSLVIYGPNRFGDLPSRLTSAIMVKRQILCSILKVPYKQEVDAEAEPVEMQEPESAESEEPEVEESESEEPEVEEPEAQETEESESGEPADDGVDEIATIDAVVAEVDPVLPSVPAVAPAPAPSTPPPQNIVQIKRAPKKPAPDEPPKSA